MAFPERLLHDGERITLDLRPHWAQIFVPLLWTVLIIAVLIVALVLEAPSWVVWALVAIGVVAFVFLAGVAIWRWWTTEFVLTNERFIHRRGLVAKTQRDIPLDRINDITFTQSLLERLLGSGNIIVESASEHGRNAFRFIRDPENVQHLIYAMMEEEEAQPQQVTIAPGSLQPGNDIPTQIEQLARLRDQGVLSEQEFAVKKDELLRRM